MTGTSKLTKGTADAIVAALGQVPFVEVAAATAGVTSRTVRNWLRQGQADEEADKRTLAASFFRRVVQARAAVERDLALVIFRQATQGGDWKAGAWVLSRIAPDRWTEPQRLLYSDGKRHEATGAESEEDPQARLMRSLREAFVKGQARRDAAREAAGGKLPDDLPDVSAASGNPAPDPAPILSSEPSVVHENQTDAPPIRGPPEAEGPVRHTVAKPQRDALGVPMRRGRTPTLGVEYGPGV
ncbi:MAG: hypothetical protein LC623_06995 [Halobacteriales archaeon]|nr:hypothetical protein [Halobacteriales archaeon]